MKITIQSESGQVATVTAPHGWSEMAPVAKVLAIHDAARDVTRGRPFSFISIKRS